MYKEFFGLEVMPFNTTPDASFFFQSEQHNEALARLKYAIEERKGFVLITGEIGSGKTTVCHTLLSQLDKDVKTALVTNTRLTGKELLKIICSEFDIEWKKSSHIELVHKLNDFLIDQLREDNNAVIIIDEAQNLTPKILEEIRLISNLETDKEKLVQIILMGQPELAEKLELPELKQLKQRIVTRYHIYPLVSGECEKYIYHRLNIAGAGNRKIFDNEAIDEIIKYSKGVPRLINITCDQALLQAYSVGKQKVTKEMVMEVLKEFLPPSKIEKQRNLKKEKSKELNQNQKIYENNNDSDNEIKLDIGIKDTDVYNAIETDKDNEQSVFEEDKTNKKGFWSRLFSHKRKEKLNSLSLQNTNDNEGILIEFDGVILDEIKNFDKRFGRYVIQRIKGNKVIVKEQYFEAFKNELKKDGIYIDLND